MREYIWVGLVVVVLCGAAIVLGPSEDTPPPEGRPDKSLTEPDPRAVSPAFDPDAQLRKRVVAAMQLILERQMQFRDAGNIDQDDDNEGEFGYFGELAGTVTLRGFDMKVDPVYLESPFDHVVAGRVTWHRHHFVVYIPDSEGVAHAERDFGGAPDALVGREQADAAESSWCAYAWPVFPEGPRQTFFVNEFGIMLATPRGERSYLGDDAPKPDAAFLAGAKPGVITGPIAVGTEARDGFHWATVPDTD